MVLQPVDKIIGLLNFDTYSINGKFKMSPDAILNAGRSISLFKKSALSKSKAVAKKIIPIFFAYFFYFFTPITHYLVKIRMKPS